MDNLKKWGSGKAKSKSRKKKVGKALKGEGDSRKIDRVRQRDWKCTQRERGREVERAVDCH